MKNNVFLNATFHCASENTLAAASGICHFWKMRRDYRLYELSNDEFEQLVVQILCALAWAWRYLIWPWQGRRP
jgi:hypothetical protein